MKRLNLRKVGAKMLGRGFRVVPEHGMRDPVFWRILFDQSPFRYFLALSPFPIAMAIWPDLALPISQAPLVMFGLIILIESSVFAIASPQKRRRLMPEAEAARGLDLLQQRARAALSEIAAARDMSTGQLNLMVEQSGLARVPVLTLVSVQQDGARPGDRPVLIDLDEEGRRRVVEQLFDAELTEKQLHRINQFEHVFLRAIALEARAVTAHARLMTKARSAAPDVPTAAPT